MEDSAPALVTRTRALLSQFARPPRRRNARYGRSLQEIADGAGVTIEWLRKFKAKSDHDFGVQKVQALHDYLQSLTETA